MKKTKKLLSIILVLALTLSLLPTAVSAADSIATVNGTGYASLQDAVNAAAASGSTVVMSSDIELVAQVEITSGSLTLDLAGKQIVNNSGHALYVNGGNLTITDSSAEKTGLLKGYGSSINYTSFCLDSGNVTVNGGTLEGYMYSMLVNGGNVLINDVVTEDELRNVGGTVTVNGGTLNDQIDASGGETIINGGEFTTSGSAYMFYLNGGNVTVNGGRFVFPKNFCIRFNDQSSNIVLKGGTYVNSLKVSASPAIYLYEVIGDGYNVYDVSGNQVELATDSKGSNGYFTVAETSPGPGSFKVTYKLTNLASSNTSAYVQSGYSLFTTFSGVSPEYAAPTSISIRMADAYFSTSKYTYSNGDLSIPAASITGDIVITATAIEAWAYTVEGSSAITGAGDNTMTANGTTYTKTYSSVPVGDGYSLSVKGTSPSSSTQSDAVTFNVTEVCDVTVTYNTSTNEVTVTGTGVTIDGPADFVFYYDNSTTKWSTVYIYAWNDNDTITAGWPGNTMTLVEGETDIYYAQISGEAAYVIFNDKSAQSDDIVISSVSGNMYNHATGAWTTYVPSDPTDPTVPSEPSTPSEPSEPSTPTVPSEPTSPSEPDVPSTDRVIYLQNDANWSSVYAYAWTTSNGTTTEHLGAWSGKAMTAVSGVSGLYSITVPADAVNIIFNNNNGTQTSDLTLTADKNLFNNSTNTWSYYNVCEHSYTSAVTTAPTCTATGIRTYTCSACGDSYTEVIPTTGHNYENGVCTGCGEVMPCDHVWNEGTVTTPAGCITEGVKTLTCTLCGTTTTEVIPAIGHIFVDGVCTGCGAPENCTNHVWDEGQVIQPNTCWVAGSALYTCTVCGVTETRTLPSGHKFYSTITKEPTCTSTGTETVKCYNCKYSLNKTLPKIDHNYVAGDVVAPTCTTDGYTVHTCSSCGGSANRDLVDRLGHSFSGNTCANCGLSCAHNYVDGICSICSDGGPKYVNGAYEIANAAQLYWFANQVNGGSNTINGRLVADIDLKNGTWTSIGYYCQGGDANKSLGYSGTFDGQGHTVSNFTTAGTDNEGLFGYCSSATIMNVGVINATVTGWRAGAVAGYALTSTVSNCFAKDCTIIGSTQNAIALQSGTVYIAPVTGPQGGVLKNSYAINCTLVDSTDLTVSTHPVGGTDCQNGYYYNVTAPAAFTSLWNATEVTAAQLASGEVTYLLNKGVTDGTQAWYQTCGTGLPAYSGQTVYQVADCNGSIAYSNDPNAQGSHNYTSVLTTPPTCYTNGVLTYTCNNCGDTYTDLLFTTGHNFVNGICTGCGLADPGYVAPTAPTVKILAPGLAFKDEIFYNIYFSVTNPDNVEIVEMGLITWTSSIDGDVTNAEYVCPGATDQGSYWQTRSQAIAAKNMGEQLYFKAYAKLADGSYVYSELKNYSAKDYCVNMLNNDSTAPAVKSLCVALMNYGAAAQEYFSYKTDDLMNAGLTAEQLALAASYSSDMIPALVDIGTKADGLAANGGFTGKAPSVSFGGAFGINYNFKPANTITGMKLYVWTEADAANLDTLTLENASQVIDATAGSDGVWAARYSGIAAKNAGDTVYACGVYELDGVTYYSGILAYSVSAYCGNYAEKDGNQFQPLASAAAVYTYYADAYLNQ